MAYFDIMHDVKIGHELEITGKMTNWLIFHRDWLLILTRTLGLDTAAKLGRCQALSSNLMEFMKMIRRTATGGSICTWSLSC